MSVELQVIVIPLLTVHLHTPLSTWHLALSTSHYLNGLSSSDAAVSSDDTSLAAVEREALLSALEKTNWNVSKAARILGISRDTLRYRIAKFQLSSQQ